MKSEFDYNFLSRWEILFGEEDLGKWLKKIQAACELRKLMDSLLRFNYYVDNMPIDDIMGLETQIQTKVLDKVAIPFEKAQIDLLMDEMNNSFIKLQN